MQRKMRRSSGVYLASLALDEGLFLLMQVNTQRQKTQIFFQRKRCFNVYNSQCFNLKTFIVNRAKYGTNLESVVVMLIIVKILLNSFLVIIFRCSTARSAPSLKLQIMQLMPNMFLLHVFHFFIEV